LGRCVVFGGWFFRSRVFFFFFLNSVLFPELSTFVSKSLTNGINGTKLPQYIFALS